MSLFHLRHGFAGDPRMAGAVPPFSSVSPFSFFLQEVSISIHLCRSLQFFRPVFPQEARRTPHMRQQAI
jgi:hypothetical protein